MGIFTKYDVFLWKIKRIISFLMKHLLTFILSVLLLTACGNREHVQFEKLQQIDSIAEINADSAVAMIKAINRDTLLGNDNKYYFDLLEIRTNDKAYIAHTSDSAILSVINYFENHDFNNLLPVAYYYGGRVYSDLGDAPQALEYFHKALDCPNINSHTMAVAYAQIASLYHEQKVYDLAIPAYKKAIKLNKDNNNYISLLYNKHSLGEILFVQNQNDSALVLFNEIIKQAKEIGYTKLIASTKQSLAELYLFEKDYKKASDLLNSIKNDLPKEDSTTIANTFAHLYYRLNNLDSTIFYCNKLIKSKNLNVKRNGYAILANFYINNKDIKKATPYIIESQLISDSIQNLETPNEIIQQSSIYNYQIRERENNKLKQKTQENEIKIILLSISIFMALIIAYALRMKNKAQKERINRILNEHYQSQNLISNAENRISELEALLETETDKSQRLINELEIQKESLQLYTQQAKLREEATNAIETSDVATRFRKALDENTNPTKEDWEQLDNYINLQFPGFKSVLYKLVKLSEIEYQVSLLIKCKFSPNEIAKLIIISKSGLSNIRKRLFVKAFKTDGSASDWDKFIASL